MKTTLLIFLTSCFGLAAFGQEDGGAGIIYGRNHAFGLKAPAGWVLDNAAGVSQGIHAVFYKKGESWANGSTVMYANAASLQDSAHTSLKKLIQYDLDNFKRNYPDIKISTEKRIKIEKGVVAEVKHLSGKSYRNFEAIAYIDAGLTGIMIIMSSRTRQGFLDSLVAFESLVKSYKFIADKVEIEPK
jgi:hypothetical protein